MDELASLINDQFKQLKEAIRRRGRVNLLIAGRTGVGKSTLVNAVFQGDVATTGQGKPVTKTTRRIRKKGIPLEIFDTRGLELDRFDDAMEEIEDLIGGLAQSDYPNDHIHCAWLCLSEDSRRVEEAESKLLHLLSKRIPVVVVITKSRADQGFRATVQDLLPRASNVIRVRLIREIHDDGHALPPMGLGDLIEWTFQVVPDGQRNALVAAQKALHLKKEQAHLIVARATAAAAGIGAFPIPVADAYLLVPIQVSMLANISTTFGLPVTKAFLTTLVSSTMTGVAGTLVARSLVANLLLLIPGAGPFIHGAITGTTAAVFTTAFGQAHIKVAARKKLPLPSGRSKPGRRSVARASHAVRRGPARAISMPPRRSLSPRRRRPSKIVWRSARRRHQRPPPSPRANRPALKRRRQRERPLRRAPATEFVRHGYRCPGQIPSPATRPACRCPPVGGPDANGRSVARFLFCRGSHRDVQRGSLIL